MADQQDQSLLGGPVEKASASADASKLRGKSSCTSSYRKRQNTGVTNTTLTEKRRRKIEPQTTTSSSSTTVERRSTDSTKIEGKNNKGERKNNGADVGSPGKFS